MRVLELDDLVPGTRVDLPLYHESGRLLLAAGRTIEAEHVFALKDAGIRQIFECEEEKDIAELGVYSGRKRIPIETLEVGKPLPEAIFDEDGLVLLQKGQILKIAYLEVLKRRGLTHVYADPVHKLFQVEKFTIGLLKNVARQLEERVKEEKDLRIAPRGRPFADIVRRQKNRFTVEEKDGLLADRRGLVERTDEILRRIARGVAVRELEASACVETLADHILERPNLLLALTFLREKEDYLAEHAVGVCSVALAMGASLGYTEKQVKELALAAFLADIGMVKVPDQIVKKPGPLTPDEFREIKKHPIHGLNMLQQFPGIPEAVSLAVYQSHEREDGSGYPRQRRGHQIHDYARVLTVADTYVALGEARNHRPPNSPYKAIESLIHMARKGAYHPDMIRALLRSTSLYPIGSWVELSTGEVARVLASGGEAIDRPTVHVLFTPHMHPLEEGRIVDLRTQATLKVVRITETVPRSHDFPTSGF